LFLLPTWEKRAQHSGKAGKTDKKAVYRGGGQAQSYKKFVLGFQLENMTVMQRS
jgi:hypothetical protein